MTYAINESIFDTFPKLESDRLLFREYTMADASELFNVRTHPQVSKYLDSDVPQSPKDIEKRIALIQQAFKDKNGITWAITLKENNTLIGDFGIWRLDKQNFRGEIGYVLNPDYWGKGYMKEAMNTLIHFAFHTFNLHSLEANINPKNQNSRSILLKLGFKKEAYFRENYFYNGMFLDSEIYSLLKSDFNSK
ncbi:GNAT family protein [Tenacibaculum sp. 1_MG-2023]|uniref:GNAT family N-acetyltransferase n=1 Tax=Tenacibaculum sp. 1_MG-2023 TaxID=3062653 RepID=UPI0026E212B3|nr:GNAT family protein [Tenacibaculum sp. 1_MG-2023]MDO6674612.1 GNAT family protein [Tenacibaculum sp. 1_MG-2023]